MNLMATLIMMSDAANGDDGKDSESKCTTHPSLPAAYWQYVTLPLLKLRQNRGYTYSIRVRSTRTKQLL